MGCVHRSQQLFLAEQDPPAAQCCALGCGLGPSGLCWAVSLAAGPSGWTVIHVQPVWRPQSCSQAWGPAIFPWQTPLPWLFPCSAPCSLFPPHFLTGTGAEGSMADGLALPALAGAGQDLGVTHGSGSALEEPTSTVTLQPGWAQEAPSVTEPLAGSSLIQGCRR